MNIITKIQTVMKSLILLTIMLFSIGMAQAGGHCGCKMTKVVWVEPYWYYSVYMPGQYVKYKVFPSHCKHHHHCYKHCRHYR